MDDTTIPTTPVVEEVITDVVAPVVEDTETEVSPAVEDTTATEEVIPAVII